MPILTKENRKYLITYETLNAVTHGLGVLAAVVGATLLLWESMHANFNWFTMAALWIYAISIITFLLASTLFHALVFTKAGKIFQFLDHSGIYLVILGSYTPYTWLFLPVKLAGQFGLLSFCWPSPELFMICSSLGAGHGCQSWFMSSWAG